MILVLGLRQRSLLFYRNLFDLISNFGQQFLKLATEMFIN